jgi:hypothetical protein
VSTRNTPAARQAASTATESDVSDPVCVRATRALAAERPGATRTIGVPELTRSCAAAAKARPSRSSSA